MKRLVMLAGAALTLAASAASADDQLYRKRDCDAVIGSASAFHQCYADNFAAADRALTNVYTRLMNQKTFYVGSREGLRDVQRAWIVYKDKECDFEYGSQPSNDDYWLAHTACEIRVTEQRIRELQDRPSCTGGNSVCTPHMR